MANIIINWQATTLAKVYVELLPFATLQNSNYSWIKSLMKMSLHVYDSMQFKTITINKCIIINPVKSLSIWAKKSNKFTHKSKTQNFFHYFNISEKITIKIKCNTGSKHIFLLEMINHCRILFKFTHVKSVKTSKCKILMYFDSEKSITCKFSVICTMTCVAVTSKIQICNWKLLHFIDFSKIIIRFILIHFNKWEKILISKLRLLFKTLS